MLNTILQKNKRVAFFILVSLMILGRVYDATSTYLYTPDLTKETNVLVVFFGANWLALLAVQFVLIIITICFLYFYLFRFNPVLSHKKGLTLKEYASYLFFYDSNSFLKIFYKMPKNLNTFIAFIGFVVTMTLISISFIVGTSTTFLLLSETYRNIYALGIPFLLYAIIVFLAFYFSIQFFRIAYKNYQNQYA